MGGSFDNTICNGLDLSSNLGYQEVPSLFYFKYRGIVVVFRLTGSAGFKCFKSVEMSK